MYKYKIFPEQRLCSIWYKGRVHFDEIIKLIQEIARDPEFSPEHNGISDEREADIVLPAKKLPFSLNLFKAKPASPDDGPI